MTRELPKGLDNEKACQTSLAIRVLSSFNTCFIFTKTFDDFIEVLTLVNKALYDYLLEKTLKGFTASFSCFCQFCLGQTETLIRSD